MKSWMSWLAVGALVTGTVMAAGCERSPEERRIDERIDHAEANLDRAQEAYEEWAEGRAETTAAMYGMNRVGQELAGKGAEEQVEDIFERQHDALEDLRDRAQDRQDAIDEARGR